jgi:hypothetical protein
MREQEVQKRNVMKKYLQMEEERLRYSKYCKKIINMYKDQKQGGMKNSRDNRTRQSLFLQVGEDSDNRED